MDKTTKTPMDMSNNNDNQPNRGKPIYYKNELHYIVFEMPTNTLITKSENLSEGIFCVQKSKLSVKPKNK